MAFELTAAYRIRPFSFEINAPDVQNAFVLHRRRAAADRTALSQLFTLLGETPFE